MNIINRLAYIFLLLIFPQFVSAQADIINKADQAYMANEYETALKYYLSARDSLGSSSQLDYNIGNVYYRLGDLGHAVLFYRKALKLNPSNSDARANLTFVQTKLIDGQDTNPSWSERVKENIIFIMSPNAWAVVGIIFFAAFLVALAGYLLSQAVSMKKLSFFGGIFLLILCVLCTIVAFHSSQLAKDDKEAVIIEPVVQLSTVPRIPQDKTEQAFSLHEGALVEIIDVLSVPSDSVNPLWYEVKVNNEHRAWLPASSAEII